MFYTRLRFVRPRHPLARLAALVLGVLAIGVALMLGAIVLALLLAGGALWLVWRKVRDGLTGAPAPRAAPTPGVIDGEFEVLSQPRAPQRPN